MGVTPRKIERASLITAGSSGGVKLGPGAPTGPGFVGGGNVSAELVAGMRSNASKHEVRKLVKATPLFVLTRINTKALFTGWEDVFGKCPRCSPTIYSLQT